MIFLTGPRQVGKTTFALNWLKESGVEGTYFNWDDPAVLQAYKKNPLFFKNVIDERHRGTPVPVVFDEIHKHKGNGVGSSRGCTMSTKSVCSSW